MSSTIQEALSTSSQEKILNLLNRATVTTGHLFGRRISIEGLEGSVTFTELSQKLNELYENNISVPRLTLEIEYHIRSPNYQPKNKADEYLRNQRAGEDLDPIHTLPFFKQLQWKSEADKQLNSLFKRSQDAINQDAIERPVVGSLIKAWDSLLNSLSSWRVDNAVDRALYRWALQPNQKEIIDLRVHEEFEKVLEELRDKVVS